MFARRGIRIIVMSGVLVLSVGLVGCGSLMHPRAGEFLEQAKGASGVETQINLTNMIETSIKAVRGQTDYEAGLDVLHNQVYALKKSASQVTDEQAKTLAYAKAVTLRREVGIIFHRLWKTREDQAERDMHLDLLAHRMGELREALQAIRG
ncbi:MAG: hypothetical protein EPO64_14005 [Nitrospirae bacterium]|nr:MAG: hypothetical protein EPO64_14005 [Nitrospirota bacterium]